MMRKQGTTRTSIYISTYIYRSIYVGPNTYIWVVDNYALGDGHAPPLQPPLFTLWRVPAPRANYDERFLHLLALIHLEN